jgi:hypothetical protein
MDGMRVCSSSLMVVVLRSGDGNEEKSEEATACVGERIAHVPVAVVVLKDSGGDDVRSQGRSGVRLSSR